MTFTLDQFRLDGKVAIVTGAGGRGNSIGRAYAMGLVNAGASVVVTCPMTRSTACQWRHGTRLLP